MSMNIYYNHNFKLWCKGTWKRWGAKNFETLTITNQNESIKILKSYDTIVGLVINETTMLRTATKYSATTSKQLSQYSRFYDDVKTVDDAQIIKTMQDWGLYELTAEVA